MDKKRFNFLFDKAFESAILESYRRIQVPATTVIQTSWEAVLQKLEQEIPAKSISCEVESCE